jgi:two-component system NtrC family sensor kinase
MKSPRILILDDDNAVGELLGEMISMLGYRPTSCEDPTLALNMIDRQPFDAIISDFRMPGLDGREFYRQLRIRHPSLARRIIFLTGDPHAEEIQTFLSTTGNSCLAKPFRLSAIEALLLDTLHRPESDLAVETVAA